MAMDPSTRPSVSRYLLVTVAFLLLSTTLVLLAMNAYLLQTKGKTLATPGGSGKDAYRQGYLAARAGLKSFCPGIDAPTTSLSGTVVSTNGQTVVVRQTSLPVDPAIDGISNDRKVTLGASAAVVGLVAKDANVLAAQMASVKPGDPLPTPNTETRLSAADLKPGTVVIVEAATDVHLQANIQATRIIIQQ